MPTLPITLLALLTAAEPATPSGVYVPTSGDIVFHRSRSAQSQAIARATGSSLTHVGIVFVVDGAPVVLEAVEPVGFAPLAAWAKRAADGQIVIKRLRGVDIDEAAETRMLAAGHRFIGRHYDSYFDWSDDRVYCSELVYKVYQEALGVELGRLRPLSDFNLSDPLVAAKLKERYGSAIPKQALMVSPGDVATDDDLVSICEGAVAKCLL
jgi:hypothetical protein